MECIYCNLWILQEVKLFVYRLQIESVMRYRWGGYPGEERILSVGECTAIAEVDVGEKAKITITPEQAGTGHEEMEYDTDCWAVSKLKRSNNGF